jgi:exodeoxyribonuclease-5
MEFIQENLRELPKPNNRRIAKRTVVRTGEQILETLNNSQKGEFKAILGHVIAPIEEGFYYILEGAAGTGKTYLTTSLVEALLGTRINGAFQGKIYVTATTNKAVAVLEEKCDVISNRIEFKTIHSLLGLKEDNDEHGNIFFKVSELSNPIPPSTVAIFIDEASMIDKYLLKIIRQRIESSEVKVIFIGDFHQIPPVGEPKSQLCIESVQKDMKLKKGKLTTIVRQAEGSPIIKLATYIRENENSQKLNYDYQTEITDIGSMICMDRAEKQPVLSTITYLMKSEYFKENPDYAKVIAWRNDTVNRMNIILRKLIYGEVLAKEMLVVGEKLIANKPIMDNHNPLGQPIVLFTTNSEFEVETFSIKTKKIDDMEFKYYETTVIQKVYNSVTQKQDEIREEIDIIHPQSASKWKKFLDSLAEHAVAKKGHPNAKFLWRLFFKSKQNFADVKYNYCLTAHKSQGSTFTNTFVIEKDILANSTMPERNCILYVACTRPSTNLITIR